MSTGRQIAERHANRAFFTNDNIDFYTQAFLSHQSYGGASVGEVLYTVSRIDERKPASWVRAWQDLARVTEDRALLALQDGHGISAREAFLRAFTYYRMSVVALDVRDDEAFPATVEAMTRCFRGAAALYRPPIEIVEIPFDGQLLPGYFLRPDETGRKRPTVIIIGGAETYAEDLFFWGGAAGVLRGYHVLAVDLPGQGATPLRGMLVSKDTERPMSAVLDWLAGRSDVDTERIGTLGLSYGGYLLPRAVAFEPRIRALAASTPIHDWGALLRDTKPAALRKLPALVTEAAFKLLERADPYAARVLARGAWMHGFDSYAEAERATADWQVPVEQITCPVLSMVGDAEDPVFKVQAREFHERLTSPKQLVTFDAATGADGHCQAANFPLAHQVLYDWFDDVLAGG